MPADPAIFPADFRWGTATAAYQIEGAAREDGRGESIWDRFAATPGKVRAGDTGETACDFYHRYPEDITLLAKLGAGAFRFSISWPRILPEGRGRVNAAGLDFYDRLVDELLEHGLTPFPTLYHWDLPQVLEDEGGWTNRATADAFAELTEHVVDRLGDRITHWTTHNEPFVVAWLGYGWGEHAPGRTSRRDALAAAHVVLLSHGLAAAVIRRDAPQAELGLVLNLDHIYPATHSEADAAAAAEVDGFVNRWFLDPVFRGEYPADMLERHGDDAPHVENGDFDLISGPIDFLGINNYTRQVVRAPAGGGDPVHVAQDAPHTVKGWEVYPEGLHDLLVRVHKEYGPIPLYVTENGAAFSDVRGHDGQVHDPERCAYLDGYIGAVGRAIAEGVPVQGYFVWSFLDNFEWATGYSERFGIVYVDYPTLERVPKDSFRWYRDLVAQHRGLYPDSASTSRPTSAAVL